MYVLFIAAAGMMMQACGSNTKKNDNRDSLIADSIAESARMEAFPDTIASPGKNVKSFLENATVGSMMEIELGKVAQKNSKNVKVKAFGNLMVKDHGHVLDSLKAIAKEKVISLPEKLPAKEQEHIDEFKKLMGPDFDKRFVDMMVNDHADAVNLFKDACSNADAKVSAFASKTLKVIEEHAAKAKTLAEKL